MRAALALFASIVAALGLLLASPPAHAGVRSAQDALNEAKVGRKPYNVVQNRFFLKSERFEIAPAIGYVPNNSFVRRITAGAFFCYHFSEVFGAEGTLMYAPDLGTSDLKGLTYTLIDIAREGGGSNTSSFRQPLDKLSLGAIFSARWSPIYGKINLIGEKVLNFDLYGTLGLGMLSIRQYYATYNSDFDVDPTAPRVLLEDPTNKVAPGVNVGLGMNFFLSSALAVKLDARNFFYVGDAPKYTATAPDKTRLYADFIASVSLAIFFPSMQPRLSNF